LQIEILRNNLNFSVLHSILLASKGTLTLDNLKNPEVSQIIGVSEFLRENAELQSEISRVGLSRTIAAPHDINSSFRA
jgi:hypothetical protein